MKNDISICTCIQEETNWFCKTFISQICTTWFTIIHDSISWSDVYLYFVINKLIIQYLQMPLFYSCLYIMGQYYFVDILNRIFQDYNILNWGWYIIFRLYHQRIICRNIWSTHALYHCLISEVTISPFSYHHFYGLKKYTQFNHSKNERLNNKTMHG